MPTAASGWMWFVHHGLNGSVSWYARPLVSKSTVGSVLFIQLGGISCVPVDSHSYPWTMLFVTGVPFTIVYEPLWKSYQVLKLSKNTLELPTRSSRPGFTAIQDSERFELYVPR